MLKCLQTCQSVRWQSCYCFRFMKITKAYISSRIRIKHFYSIYCSKKPKAKAQGLKGFPWLFGEGPRDCSKWMAQCWNEQEPSIWFFCRIKTNNLCWNCQCTNAFCFIWQHSPLTWSPQLSHPLPPTQHTQTQRWGENKLDICTH